MLIRCPECLFERKVDLSKIPPTAQLATCPKCRFKFRFREYIVGNTDAELDAIHSPVQMPSYTDAPDHTPYPADSRFIDHGRTDGSAESSDSSWPDNSSGSTHDEPERDAADNSPERFTPSARSSYYEGPSVASDDSDVGEDASDEDHHASPAHHDPQDQFPPYTQAQYSVAAHDTAHGDADSMDSQAEDALSLADHLESVTSLDSVATGAPEASSDPTSFYQQADAGTLSRGTTAEASDEVVVKPHRHLGTISDYGDEPRHKSGKGDIWDAIAAMGDDDSACVDSFIRHSVMEAEIPWENRGKRGLLAAWWQTGGQALFAPSSFFSMIKGAGGVASPLMFFLFTSILGVVLEVGGLVLLSTLWANWLPTLMNMQGLVFDVHTAPVIAADFLGEAVIRVLLMAIAYHICLRLVGARCKPFATTFRVMAYSSATALFGIIPVVGIVISRFWFLVLSMIGMRYAHNLGWRKTILVVLPLYVFSMVVSVLLFVVGY